MQDKLESATRLLREWYWDEIRSLADAAIEACVGRLVTELTRDDLQQLPRSLWASARASFVPYRATERYRERDPGQDAREFLQEWVDQTTDGHEFVIYTFKAGAALIASEHDDAYEDEIGEKPPSPEVAACYAMRADLWRLLDARDDEWIESDEEGDEE